jgi:DNA-binding transcriptional MerR regulator
MRMQKVQFRIGQLAKQLNVEKFVIRFWEKEFELPTNRSHGGQRFYSEEDLKQFKAIKALLYDKGFTIAGAKKLLSKDLDSTIFGSHKTTLQPSQGGLDTASDKLIILKEHLIKLRNLL